MELEVILSLPGYRRVKMALMEVSMARFIIRMALPRVLSSKSTRIQMIGNLGRL